MVFKIDFPTRVTINSKTAIDNFITNINSYKMEARGMITKISDHDAQILDIFNVNCKHRNKIKREIRTFNNTNLKMFAKLISKENWMEVYQAPVESKYDLFHTIFKHHFDSCFPKKFKFDKTYNKRKWITDELSGMKHELVELEKEFRLTKNQQTKNEIKEKRIILNQTLYHTQKRQIKEKIENSSNKVKTTWSIIKAKTGKDIKEKNNIELTRQGQTIANPLKVSETFNNFFINAVDNLITPNIIPTNANILTNKTETKFTFKNVTEQEKNKIISSFENKNSTGIDDIPITVINNH